MYGRCLSVCADPLSVCPLYREDVPILRQQDLGAVRQFLYGGQLPGGAAVSYPFVCCALADSPVRQCVSAVCTALAGLYC